MSPNQHEKRRAYDDILQLACERTFLPSPRDTHRIDTSAPNWTNGSYSLYNLEI
jgi:hypothetical protein